MRIGVLTLVLLASSEAAAYSPAQPTRHDVRSPNGAFILDVDPAAERLTVYAAGDRATPLWSFQRHVWQEQHFLSDDGSTVAVVAWRFVQVKSLADGVCVEFWGRAGQVREYTFAELCPHPARYHFEPGPVGSFWRKWYTEATGNGATLRVRTTDEFEYLFAMGDGRVIGKFRVGLAWWMWWALAALGLAAAVIVVRRWRRARQVAEPAAAPDTGRV